MNNRKNARAIVGKFILEFLVVFLGIVMAQALGERAQRKQNIKYEHELLFKIVSDLESDTVGLNSAVSFLTNKLDGLTRQIEIMRNPNNLSVDSLALQANYLGNLYLFKPNMYTFLTMQEQGGMSYIKNQGVQQVIVQYYRQLDELNGLYEKLSDIMLTLYYPTFIKHYDRIEKKVVNEDFFRSSELKNYFGVTTSEVRNQLYHLQETIETGQRLRRDISDYLEE